MLERSSRALPLLLGLLLATPVLARPQVLLFPAVGAPTSVTVQGRVLKDRGTSGSNVLSQNLRRLTAGDWDGAPVEVSLAGSVIKTRTDHDGVFEATFTLSAKQALKPGFEEVIAKAPGAAAVGAVRILDPHAPFLVISDFDDTLSVSNVLSTRGLLKSALLQSAATLPAVPGMSDLYGCLVDGNTPSPGLAVVSGSPHQYASRITGFLWRNGFPFAGVYPRDFGLRTLRDYKQPVIRKLMESAPQKVILIGDSGEHDPEVYAQIRKEFPDRVLAIYIHDVGRAEDRSRFEGMILFKDAADAAKDAAQRGFISKACGQRMLDSEG